MKPRVIDWDGSHLPEALRELPPGRYAVEPIDDLPPLTPEEDVGLRAALDQLDAGRGIPLADVVREIRRGSQTMTIALSPQARQDLRQLYQQGWPTSWGSIAAGCGSLRISTPHCPTRSFRRSRALRRAATRRRAVPPAGNAGESPPRHARLAVDPRRTRAALSRGPVSARRPRPSVLLLSCQRMGDRHQAGARVCRSCCCARALLLA